MPWEMSEVLVELLRQAHQLLKPGGRLVCTVDERELLQTDHDDLQVYWLPTVPSEYQESDVPTLKGLRLVANSEQNFGKWARRVCYQLFFQSVLSAANAIAYIADNDGENACG